MSNRGDCLSMSGVARELAADEDLPVKLPSFEMQAGCPPAKIWLTPPTKMDETRLKMEGYYAIYSQVGARTEIPGCSLCMGNQARVAPKATILSTSTRNFDDRMGDGARVYLGSAELAAVAALKGALPSPAEYFETMKAKVLPAAEELYAPLDFAGTKDFTLGYAGDR